MRLLRAADASKDQSYFLFTLGQQALSELEFPVGELSKAEVRAVAVFAPNARVRPRLVPAPAAPAPLAQAVPCPVAPAPEPARPPPARRPIPWVELFRRTFRTDVLTCPRCGGTRRLVAVGLRSSTAQAILEHLRLPSRPLPLAWATSPPQLRFW